MNKHLFVTVSCAALLLLVGCQSTPEPKAAAVVAPLVEPTKEILVFTGDSSRPYTVLGSVEYKHAEGVRVGDDNLEHQKIVERGLKSAAFVKFGEKVDAIINAKTGSAMQGGVWGAYGVAFGAKNLNLSGSGVAVQYKN